jgi:RNA polymerase sigma-70 factor, ECF subfamily
MSDADAQFRRELLAAIPSVRAFARGLCGYREIADDLAQETMVKAWAARDRYRPEGNFKAWLFRILRNHYYEQGRRSNRFVEWDQVVADRVLTAAPAQQGAIHLADVQRGLATLTAEQREAVLLVGPGGFAYEEVAEITGCAVGTVKSRVARARAALTRFVDGPLPEPLADAPVRVPIPRAKRQRPETGTASDSVAEAA